MSDMINDDMLFTHKIITRKFAQLQGQIQFLSFSVKQKRPETDTERDREREGKI